MKNNSFMISQLHFQLFLTMNIAELMNFKDFKILKIMIFLKKLEIWRSILNAILEK